MPPVRGLRRRQQSRANAALTSTVARGARLASVVEDVVGPKIDKLSDPPTRKQVEELERTIVMLRRELGELNAIKNTTAGARAPDAFGDRVAQISAAVGVAAAAIGLSVFARKIHIW